MGKDCNNLNSLINLKCGISILLFLFTLGFICPPNSEAKQVLAILDISDIEHVDAVVLQEGEMIGGWRYGNDNTIEGSGDFNGDGRDDFIIMSHGGIGILTHYSSGWRMLMAKPNGTWFGAWNFHSQLNTIQGIGDFNGDGRDDILITSDWGIGILTLSEDTLTTLMAEPNGWIGGWNYHTKTNTIRGIGDFNGDGRADFLNTSGWGIGIFTLSGNTLTTLMAEPNGWIGGWNYHTKTNTIQVIGDFNGDGRSDFLNTSGWGVGIFTLSGSTLTTLMAEPNGWIGGWNYHTETNTIQGIGDFNGDGRADFLNTSGWGVGIFTLSGSTLTTLMAEPNGWIGGWISHTEMNSIRGIGDFNGDGKDDFLNTSPWGMGISTLSGSNLQLLTANPNGAMLGDWLLQKSDMIVSIGQFNKNPGADILIQKSNASMTCSNKKIDEVTAPATASAHTAKIDCNLTLNSSHVVTKRLIFEGESATGVTVNCNGATINGGEGTYNYQKRYTIEIKSRKTGTQNWETPENITIKNCNIVGAVRVWGMTRVYSDEFKESSQKIGHTIRARNNAPKNIIFDNVRITAVGSIPLYLSPGVTYFELKDSEIMGKTDSVVIYLDAESCCNTIKNNYIHATTSEREVMAIDGSSYNKIIGNKFSGLNHGGIYLYRNCGERGVIRHSTPSHNQIINNVFYYNKYTGGNPSVYLGSRNGKTRKGTTGYCNDDKGYPFGSSVDNKDYARYNVVMQNQIYKRSISDMIKSKNWNNNSPNYIDHNQTVTTETNRQSGCFVLNDYKDDRFILHNQSIDVFKNSNGEPTCNESEYTCSDGDMIYQGPSMCSITETDFDCQISGNNNGCHKNVSCPSGQIIVGAAAACNLEYGTISNSILATVPVNNIKVIRESDYVQYGLCYIGDNTLSRGQEPIKGIYNNNWVRTGCNEYDQNGGDCHIKGILFCR